MHNPSFEKLLDNVDALLSDARQSVATKTAEQGSEEHFDALTNAVDSLSAHAKTAAADLRLAAEARAEERELKVAAARLMFRTGCRLVS